MTANEAWSQDRKLLTPRLLRGGRLPSRVARLCSCCLGRVANRRWAQCKIAADLSGAEFPHASWDALVGLFSESPGGGNGLSSFRVCRHPRAADMVELDDSLPLLKVRARKPSPHGRCSRSCSRGCPRVFRASLVAFACSTNDKRPAKMDAASLISQLSQRDTLPVDGEWPVSERARWLPALAIAIGIIYGADEDRNEPATRCGPKS